MTLAWESDIIKKLMCFALIVRSMMGAAALQIYIGLLVFTFRWAPSVCVCVCVSVERIMSACSAVLNEKAREANLDTGALRNVSK